MNDTRQGGSGPIRQRVIASGKTMLPPSTNTFQGETFVRRGNERVWVYVFPLTEVPSSEPPGSLYAVVALPSKYKGMADDEWAPTFLVVNGPVPYSLEVEWTIYGVVP